jgi:hypothetical protein
VKTNRNLIQRSPAKAVSLPALASASQPTVIKEAKWSAPQQSVTPCSP